MHRSIGSLRKFWHISHKSDEREEELLKFLNNVNCESWHFGNIWYNYKTRISDPIFCRRFIPFQKEFQVKDWDLRLFNCDILKKIWIISGLEGRKLQIGSSVAASVCWCRLQMLQ